MVVDFLSLLSQLMGWIYTICWSLSFYPQAILNARRKSTSGTTVDFPSSNVLGFVAYFISNVCFLYSPQIRAEYARRNAGLTPTVRFNDAAFAGHAIIICSITLSQYWLNIWGFGTKRSAKPRNRISNSILCLLLGCICAVLVVILIVATRKDSDPRTGWAWIDVIYTISYIKIFITLIKYVPQVFTNIRNGSTQGWAIGQILLDFAGGILSIGQLFIDAYLQGDWSGVTGNPGKLLLANISIFFDIIFMTQHYCIYRGKTRKASDDGENQSLLGQDGSHRSYE